MGNTVVEENFIEEGEKYYVPFEIEKLPFIIAEPEFLRCYMWIPLEFEEHFDDENIIFVQYRVNRLTKILIELGFRKIYFAFQVRLSDPNSHFNFYLLKDYYLNRLKPGQVKMTVEELYRLERNFK